MTATTAAMTLRRQLHRLLRRQAALTALVAAGAMATLGLAASLAALYGGVAAMMCALALGRRLGREAGGDAATVRGALLRGLAERLALVAGAFALGVGALGLAPAPMLAAFAVCQLGYALAADTSRRPTQVAHD